MKLKLLFLAPFVFLFSNEINAQSIPNAGFENWSMVMGHEDPDQWVTTNESVLIAYDTTARRSTDAHSGNYALELHTIQYTDSGTGITDTSYAGAYTGYTGIPYSSRPTDMKFYAKYHSSGADQGYIYAALYRWNTVTSAREMIGYAYGLVDTTSTYTSYTLPFTYGSVLPPDTILVYLLSSVGKGIPGSTLLIDDISFSVPLGVNEYAFPGINAFPNPAENIVNIDLSALKEKESKMELFDIGGNMVRSWVSRTNKTVIERNDLPSGMYFLKISNDEKNYGQKIIFR
jgi:hypothetical protein